MKRDGGSERATLSEEPMPPWFCEVGQVRERFVLSIIDSGSPLAPLLRPGSTMLVGRDAAADIPLSCAMASRRHLALHVGEHVEIEDLGSSNGTLVAGKRLHAHARRVLWPGEVVLIGSTVLILRKILLGSNPPAVATREHLIEGMGRAGSGPGGLAIIKLTLSESVTVEWLASFLANVFGPTARLAGWGEGSWRVACHLPDQGASTAACRFAVARLASCGLLVKSEEAFFSLPVDEGELRCHPILAAPAGPALGIVARSKSMQALLAMVGRVAGSDLSVLLTGETGAGKEVVASQIHHASPRATRSFLRLNCATLSESLLESELFGHEAGAFTGAKQQKRGLLEISDGGTVFLDEVAELPSAVQAKILRAVELRQFLRVGGSRTIPTNVRFVSATNRNLQDAIRNGRFREDLYFRLAGITLRVPPLRERPEDIPVLAQTFLESTDRTVAKATSFSSAAMAQLCAYAWPGNVRELRNAVARACLLCDGPEILPRHLVLDGSPAAEGVAPEPVPASAEDEGAAFPFADPVAARQSIAQALRDAAGNQTLAAKRLGISRRTLVNRLEEYGFPRPRQRPPRG
jgi:DNA-binding NtrC family response regulator